MKSRTVEEQIMRRCRHFTGIQNDTCDAGVAYISVRDSSGSPYRWPCFSDDGAKTSCQFADFPTKEEAEREAEESRQHFEVVLKEIADGKCPHCHKEVKHRQVGPCVYGSCGHRLYQGKANPKFAPTASGKE